MSKFVRLADASPADLVAAGLPIDFKVGTAPVSEETLQSAVESFRTREEEFEMLRRINGSVSRGKSNKGKNSDLDRKIRQALSSR
jgi:hypothetical protein